MSLNAVAIICSRLDSKRLPGKALIGFEGLSALDHIILRLKDSDIPIYVGIPNGEAPSFRHLLEAYPDISLFEGDPLSPLHRTAQILEHMKSEGTLPHYVVRITHDDPLIDQRTMLELIEKAERENAGYAYSPGIVEGAGVEVIRSENILEAAKREEPTEFISYFVKGIQPYPKVVTVLPRMSIKRPYRLTIDYPEDALVLRIVLREVGAMASLDTICKYLDQRPYVLNINRLPDVTFYTCAKDAEPWVSDTMLSVLASNIPNMEYICVDDGSKDHTLSEMAKFSSDKRLTLVVNDQNRGLASSSNIALANAKGRLVCRVDADDMIMSAQFLEQWGAIQKLISEGRRIVYPAYAEMNEYGGIEVDHIDPSKEHHAGCAVMEKAWLNEWRFKDGLRHWDGLELYKRASDSANPAYLDTPIWMYRKHARSMSKQPGREEVKP